MSIRFCIRIINFFSRASRIDIENFQKIFASAMSPSSNSSYSRYEVQGSTREILSVVIQHKLLGQIFLRVIDIFSIFKQGTDWSDFMSTYADFVLTSIPVPSRMISITFQYPGSYTVLVLEMAIHIEKGLYGTRLSHCVSTF